MYKSINNRNSDGTINQIFVEPTDNQIFEILENVNLSGFVKNNTENWISRLNKVIQDNPKVKEALVYIINNYKKKRKHNPYKFGYMHCIEAASLMAEHWFDNPDEIAAALLHDVREDIPNWEKYLQSTYNENIVNLVKSLTEKDKSWYTREEGKSSRQERKSEEMEKVLHFRPNELALKLADQISNIAETVNDIEKLTPGDRQRYWESFNAGYDKQIWKYETLSDIIEKRIQICKDENLFKNEDEEIKLKSFHDKFKYLVNKLKWITSLTK